VKVQSTYFGLHNFATWTAHSAIWTAQNWLDCTVRICPGLVREQLISVSKTAKKITAGAFLAEKKQFKTVWKLFYFCFILIAQTVQGLRLFHYAHSNLS